MLSKFLQRAPEVYKGVVAFVASLGATEGTLQAVVESTGVAPASWLHVLAVGGSALTGVVTWLGKVRPTFDAILEAAERDQKLAERLIAEYREQD